MCRTCSVVIGPASWNRASGLQSPPRTHLKSTVGCDAREPNVQETVLRTNLYQRIGERSGSTASDDCWESRAAVAFEALVWRQVMTFKHGAFAVTK